jgi:GNAT superfamily N-acetyltransferase
MVFDVAEKGFVPVPIILRKLIRHLTAPELRVLIYLQLRASRYGICYPTYDEIVHELGLMERHALKKQEADSSQTYIVHRNGSVVGYYSLTVGSVDRKDCPLELIAEMPQAYPIPVILLARLAVHQTEQGRGLGSALLKDAFHRVASAAGIVGARALLVHAIDSDARSFYEHFNFDEFHAGSLHLMLALKEVRAAIAGGV